MKFAKILAMAKAKGYAGEETPDALAAWLAEQNIDVHDDETGAAIDVKSLPKDEPKAKTVLTLAKDEPDKKDARQHFQTGKGWVDGPGRVDGRGTAEIQNRRNAKSVYTRKIAATKSVRHPNAAVWPDADLCEEAGAWFRSYAMKRLGMDDYKQKAEDTDIITKAGSTVGLNLGAALVPEEYVANLIWLTENYGVARRVANVMTMNRDNLTLPRQTGLISMAFASEGSTATAADQNTDNVTLTAKKVVGLSQMSNELLSDSAIDIGNWWARSFAEAQAKVEDQCYFIGDGTSTYGGNVGLAQALPAGAYISATGSGWSSYVLADFNGAIGSVENVNSANLAFCCSRQFYLQVMSKLAFAAGGVTAGEIFGGSDLSTGADAMFMGFPVYFVQVMPTATSGSESRPVYFGDFKSGSMLGVRKDLEVAVSDQRYFETDSFAIRGVSRFAVNVHGDGRGSTFGPIVSLTST